MGRKRPKIELAQKPEARTGDLEQLFATESDLLQSNDMALIELPLRVIEADPLQPRKIFDEISLADLSESIRRDGVIQPIEVVQIGRSQYRIVHGERRWRAAQLAGLSSIPALIRKRDYDSVTLFVRQLVENMQREDLNDIDRAAGLARLRELLQEELNREAETRGEKPWSSRATWAKVGERLGYSRQRVNQLTQLLLLPDEIQDSVRDGSLKERDTRIYHQLTVRQQRALHRARIIEGQLTQEEAIRVASYLKRGETASVAEAIDVVKAGNDLQTKSEAERRWLQAQKGIKRIGEVIGQFDSAEFDPEESAELLTQLQSIQYKLHLLLNELSGK